MWTPYNSTIIGIWVLSQAAIEPGCLVVFQLLTGIRLWIPEAAASRGEESVGQD